MENNLEPSATKIIPRQAIRLDERRKAESIEVECCGLKITVSSGVYIASTDSELMAETVAIKGSESFLEIGCGTGVVSIVLAKRAKYGVGVDINDRAVVNSQQNSQRHDVTNVEFFKSDVFENVQGKFDVVLCNPPYTKHEITDDIDRMFWDPQDEMKQKFFEQVSKYLKPQGRIYLGWANFADIDVNLPFKLAEANGYKLVNVFERPHPRNEFSYFVFEFIKMD